MKETGMAGALRGGHGNQGDRKCDDGGSDRNRKGKERVSLLAGKGEEGGV